jgi:hypothetical protein
LKQTFGRVSCIFQVTILIFIILAGGELELEEAACWLASAGDVEEVDDPGNRA